VLHFTLSEIEDMDWDELALWHAEAAAIVRAMHGER
jgi:hypothetical protein